MGSHRLHLRSVLVASLFCFSAFAGEYSGDLSVIISLLEDNNNVADIIPDYFLSFDADLARLQELPGMARDLRSIESNSTYFRNNGLRFITNTLWSISQKLESDEQYHLTGNTSISYESLYVHDVRNDDIYSRLGDLQSSINNLTNYLCYSPAYTAAVITNLPFLFMPIDPYLPAATRRQRISELFYAFYGRNPTTEEVNRLTSVIVPNNNIRKYFTDGRIYYLDASSLPASYKDAAYNRILYDWALNVPNTTEQQNRDSYSRAYNYLYGTRLLTDTSISISNTLANIEGLTIGISNVISSLSDASIVPSGISSSSGNSLISSVQNGVEQVENFTEEPQTNIVGEVLSGAIHAISDADYTAEINDTQNSTPDMFHDLDGVISELNEFTAPFDDIAEDLTTYDTTQDFVMEIDYGFLGSGNHTAVITVPNLRNTQNRYGSTLDNIFTVAANILRLCMMMVFFARGYDSLSRHCYQMGYLPI